ncbi:nitroreductase family deazaflavin-dependent oxidoreductase [Agromyces binzhouensis]|uniref:nitroreductase family deazaflavin-dependent oxidoreductase n=1 Tax=Agromyces binzhouensis TaxID=1817495 RepID=UPI00363FD36F
MAMGRFTRGWLTFIKHTLNHVTLGMARRGIPPFSFVRTVGRRSGRTFETPLILARVPGGFVAELTYGDEVNWYRNLIAAGGGTVGWKRREIAVEAPEPMATDAGLRAFGPPAEWVLRLLGRHEFRLLREATPPAGA